VAVWLRTFLGAEARSFKVRETLRTKLRNQNKYVVSHRDVPLFPGYLFVRSDKLDMLEQHGKILGPIRTGLDFATVRDAVVQHIAKSANDKDVIVPNVEGVKAGDLLHFLPGSIFGAAVLEIQKVLKNAVVEATVHEKSGTKRLVTVSARTISSALMKA
jgi:transcription antitermination factor NusG